MSVKTMYRLILKGMKSYPSRNRSEMRVAIMADVRDWVKITDEEEKAKAMKKLRMLYGHITMWNMKMAEVRREDSGRIDRPTYMRDINHKKDKDFVYF